MEGNALKGERFLPAQTGYGPFKSLGYVLQQTWQPPVSLVSSWCSHPMLKRYQVTHRQKWRHSLFCLDVRTNS